MTTLIFVGHLNQELLLAGASLALSIINVAGFNVLMGMSSALDTFCGQAYEAKQYHMVGIYTQRAMLVITLELLLQFVSQIGLMCYYCYFTSSSPLHVKRLGLESWTFEVMVFLSGALPNPALQTSALSICINVLGSFWMIPFGVSVAESTRISNELGVGYPNAAYVAVLVTLMMALTCGVVDLDMWSCRVCFDYFDAFQTTLQGVARGCGWQKLGAYVNLGSFYLVGIPLSALLTFVFHMNSQGLFLGLVTTLVVQVVCFLFVTWRTDWEKEVNKAAIRV
ncbi:protein DETOXIFICATION 16-like [Cicer arietinum]